MLLPACGPAHAFPGYPDQMPAIAEGTMILHGIPNCVPSLHMASALLLVLYRLPGRFRAWATGYLPRGLRGRFMMVDGVAATLE